MSWTTSAPYGTPIVGQTPSPYRAWRSSSARSWTPPPAGWAPPGVNPTPAATPTDAWPFVLTGALIFAGGLIFAKGLRLF